MNITVVCLSFVYALCLHFNKLISKRMKKKQRGILDNWSFISVCLSFRVSFDQYAILAKNDLVSDFRAPVEFVVFDQKLLASSNDKHMRRESFLVLSHLSAVTKNTLAP